MLKAKPPTARRVSLGSDGRLPSTKPRASLLSMEELRQKGSYVPMVVDDLVAYEYVDARGQWQWGLATVAALPDSHLVQLLRWRDSAALLAHHSGGVNNSHSPEETTGLLGALLESRAAISMEAAVLQTTLATRRASHAARRRGVEANAHAEAQKLSEARSRLREIKVSDWREIRSYSSPPAMVVLVMEAVLTLLGHRVLSWPHIKNIIRGTEFMHTLEQFDPAKLSEATQSKVRQKYMSNPKFTYADAMNGSRALGYLQQWVVAHMSTAGAAEGLREFDIAHAKDRAVMTEMKGHIEAFQQTLRDYSHEEVRLRTLLGDPPLTISNSRVKDDINGHGINNSVGHSYSDNNNSNDNTPRNHNNNNNNNNIDDPTKNTNGENTHSSPNAISPDHIKSNDIQCSNKSGSCINAPSSYNVERIYGTSAVWSFSNQTIVTLRSSILCNYDRPESMAIRLTPDQVHEIEDALKHRDSNRDEERGAEAARREKLQEALETLRIDHAHALKRLQALESEHHDILQDLDERKRELDKLNQFIMDKGLSLQTPRCPVPDSSTRSTPRGGLKGFTIPAPNPFPPLPLALHATPRGVCERDDVVSLNSTFGTYEEAEARIEELEKRLMRALHENPTAAQVHLLEDDLRALQEELRNKKEELDSFRNAHACKYYTSSALRMDQESSSEGQLAAAQQQIAELEFTLTEALEAARQQQQKLTEEDNTRLAELQGQVQKLQNELQQQARDAEGAAERLNEELHAHNDTRRKLRAKEQELKALWDQQNTAEGEIEATREAIRAREQQVEQLREQLRAREEGAQLLEERLTATRRLQDQGQHQQQRTREGRAGQLRSVLEELMQEAKRQKHEANSTASVIEEVHKLLGKSLIA